MYSFGLSFSIVGILLNVLAANIESTVFLYASFAAFFGFLLVAVSYTLRQVVTGAEMSSNRLVGAVCIYLLLGVLWAIAYTVLNALSPESFQGFTPMQGEAWDSE